MKHRINNIAILILAGLMTTFGCAADKRPLTAGRTAEERQQIIKPGMFNSRPADGRRRYFDFYNEQVIHQDVKVSTVFMGDSITQLWELCDYFKPYDGVIVNRGISGDLASVMAKRFEADVLQLRPRNVVILAGTNDVARMLNDKKPADQMIQSVTESIETMIVASKTAGINTLVCAIIPTNDDNRMHKGKKPILPKINANIQKLCAKHDAIFVDYASAMQDAKGDLPKELAGDGLHPHWKGYQIMSSLLIDAADKHGLRF